MESPERDQEQRACLFVERVWLCLMLRSLAERKGRALLAEILRPEATPKKLP